MNGSPIFKQINAPAQSHRIILRVLTLSGVLFLLHFVWWYFSAGHAGHPVLFWLLSISLGYKLLHLLYEWYYLSAIDMPDRPVIRRQWTVDILTTYVPGEPYEMIERTLRAMVNVSYPHTNILCDEGNDPRLKNLCVGLGIIHVYRGTDKTDAKAGNINHALREVARGEICVILDPDHIPAPELLDRVLPYFEDEKVGFVQTIQGYYNQSESSVAKGAAEQTYMFYGPLMMGMHRHGTVQAIGANCAFRRKALDSIGGHAAGLCEDMHTSMRLHAGRWRSVYVPERLTAGRTPSTLSAFYRQQLKWARGSFELLLNVYPRLFRWLSPRQRIHYFLLPLYFLYGLVGLIDLSVPVISLISFNVPLFIDFHEFALRILPTITVIILIRHYAQRYVLEQHETGFHFTGGILRVCTWWIYLLGFICTLLRVRIPYVPTPKDNRIQNEWLISLPNLAVIMISAVAILYGLRHDKTPYTWIMAGFAGMNIILLATGVSMGLRRWAALLRRHSLTAIVATYKNEWAQFRRRIIYRNLRNNFAALTLLFLALGVSVVNLSYRGDQVTLSRLAPPQIKQFRTPGMTSTGDACSLSGQHFSAGELRNMKMFHLKGAESPVILQCAQILSYCKRALITPFFCWEPPPVPSPNMPAECTENHPVLKEFAQQLARLCSDFDEPIILCPRPLTGAPDSIQVKTYQTLHDKLREAGADNITFAWQYQPDQPQLYPGADYVDLAILSQPADEAVSGFIRQWKNERRQHPVFLLFDKNPAPEAHRSLLDQFSRYRYPVFGWADAACLADQAGPEREPAVFPNSTLTNAEAFEDIPHFDVHLLNRGVVYHAEKKAFEWWVNGAPLYVKGVAYNPEQDWRDDKWPLTRRQLEHDFEQIREMGANTILRVGPGLYDQNILTVAGETGLKVLYSFDFDPQTDFLHDTVYLKKQKRKIIQFIQNHNNLETILAWNLGCGTWNGLEQYFNRPYLLPVRQAYLRAVEDIAREIKQIDPLRPVLTELHGDRQLKSALRDVRRFAPSIDILALSGHFGENADYVHRTMREEYPTRPYLVSAFGPMWDTQLMDTENRVRETSSFEKARYYSSYWNKSVVPFNGSNLGGVAYCWRDRREGAATLSGIVDYKGRLKPAYFALKQVWTGTPQQFPIADITLFDEAGFSGGRLIQTIQAHYAGPFDGALRYEWHIERQEFLGRVDEMTVEYDKLGQWGFKLYREYCKKTKMFYPTSRGNMVHYMHQDADPYQRIYLHVSDDQGHVVTASCPLPVAQNR